MHTNIYVSIDFDGTITDTDITDAVIQRFARPGWEEAERLWEDGVIGSRECLEAQFSLVDTSLDNILKYSDTYTIDKDFKGFLAFLKDSGVPYGIISDGFQIVIERMLSRAGIHNIPVYANRLVEEGGKLKTSFPYHNKNCSSGVCKCEVAKTLSGDAPVIHIGDGRSDFCISEEAELVFSKSKLTAFCREKAIRHIEFADFSGIKASMSAMLSRSVSRQPERPVQTGIATFAPRLSVE